MKVFEAAALLCVGTALVTFAAIAFALGGFAISADTRMLFLQALVVAGGAFLLLAVRKLQKISAALGVATRG